MNHLLEILRETIRLASELEKASRKHSASLPHKMGGFVISLADIDPQSSEYQLCEQRENELREYLEALDFEIIKDIQSIMYLGRDSEYNQAETCQQRFASQRKYMDSLGWHDKSNEIDKIVEKLPLAQYLKEGMRILGMQ